MNEKQKPIDIKVDLTGKEDVDFESFMAQKSGAVPKERKKPTMEIPVKTEERDPKEILKQNTDKLLSDLEIEFNKTIYTPFERNKIAERKEAIKSFLAVISYAEFSFGKLKEIMTSMMTIGKITIEDYTAIFGAPKPTMEISFPKITEAAVAQRKTSERKIPELKSGRQRKGEPGIVEEEKEKRARKERVETRMAEYDALTKDFDETIKGSPYVSDEHKDKMIAALQEWEVYLKDLERN